MPHLYRRALTALVSLALCAGLLFNAVPAVQAASIIYVAPAPEGLAAETCGSGWDNPCDLQYALTTLAQPGDELWVKAGTYRPAAGVNTNASFILRPVVALYGGFAGNESAREQRNITAHPSILTGDLGIGSAYHVVRAVGIPYGTGTILDGFTITGGNAAMDPFGSEGGGIHLYESNVVLNNLVISGNQAERGGGLFIYGGIPELNHVTITNNRASHFGGGAYILTSGAWMVDVTIANNVSDRDGGGLYADDFSGGFDGVHIANNLAATGDGGGAYFYNTWVTMWNTTISGNGASDTGGGLYYHYDPVLPYGSMSQTVQDTLFMGNHARLGGGVHALGEIIIRESAFVGNSALENGGAIFLDQLTSPASTFHSVSNVTIYDNYASMMGEGVYALETKARLTNVTISTNMSGVGPGGVIANQHTGELSEPNLLVANAIIWNNDGSEVMNTGTAETIIINSVVESDSGENCPWSSTTCTHVSNSDPLLMPPGDYGGTTPTIPILPGSAAINGANDFYCSAIDQRGVERVVGPCDIGAFESRGFIIKHLSGYNQVTLPNTAFALPLQVSVVSNYSEPVEGGFVKFSGPLTGPGVQLGPEGYWLAPIIGGVASQPVTANGETGVYWVDATMTGSQYSTGWSLGFDLENRKYTAIPSISSAMNPTAYGVPVNITANLAPQTGIVTIPTGTVQFKVDGADYGSPVALAAGSASLELSALAVGTRAITAEYSGDSVYNPASMNLDQTVTPLIVNAEWSSSKNPAVFGDIINYTLSLTSPVSAVTVPIGTVQFKVDGADYGDPVTLAEGIASIEVSGLTVGSRAISAAYSGDDRFQSETFSFIQTVNPLLVKYTADTDLTVSANPTPYGTPVTFSAEITAPVSGIIAPTGTVQFKVDGADYGSPVSLTGGSASLEVSGLIVGSHSISAVYSGDEVYQASTIDLNQTVDPLSADADLSSSRNPAVFGDIITYTLSLTSPVSGVTVPTGAVQFRVAGKDYGEPVPLEEGTASLEVSGIIVGDHTVLAAYSGDDRFQLNIFTLTQTVNPLDEKYTADAALTASANPAPYGAPVTFTAAISAPVSGILAPIGTVQFKVDGENYGVPQPLTGGSASLTVDDLPVGNRTVSAEYSGDPIYQPGTLTLTQQIEPLAPAAALTASHNPSEYSKTVTFTAALTPSTDGGAAPAGTVQFKVDGTDYGAPVTLEEGTASIEVTGLSIGTHTITANYSGDAIYQPVLMTLMQAVNPLENKYTAVSALSSDKNPAFTSDTVTIRMSLSAPQSDLDRPTGTVQFKVDGKNHGTPVAVVDGSASLKLSGLSAGSHTVSAVYSGDDLYRSVVTEVEEQILNETWSVYIPLIIRP